MTAEDVRRLHHGAYLAGRGGRRLICAECSAFDGDEYGSTDNAPIDYPCPTITALDAAGPPDSVIHVITEQDIDQHRPALIAWAEANGLDPTRIDPHGLTVEHDGNSKVIVYYEHQVDANGNKLVDPDRPNQVLKAHRTRPLRHALPEGIGRPLCTCTVGRLEPGCRDHPGSANVTLGDIGS